MNRVTALLTLAIALVLAGFIWLRSDDQDRTTSNGRPDRFATAVDGPDASGQRLVSVPERRRRASRTAPKIEVVDAATGGPILRGWVAPIESTVTTVPPAPSHLFSPSGLVDFPVRLSDSRQERIAFAAPGFAPEIRSSSDLEDGTRVALHRAAVLTVESGPYVDWSSDDLDLRIWRHDDAGARHEILVTDSISDAPIRFDCVPDGTYSAALFRGSRDELIARSDAPSSHSIASPAILTLETVSQRSEERCSLDLVFKSSEPRSDWRKVHLRIWDLEAQRRVEAFRVETPDRKGIETSTCVVRATLRSGKYLVVHRPTGASFEMEVDCLVDHDAVRTFDLPASVPLTVHVEPAAGGAATHQLTASRPNDPSAWVVAGRRVSEQSFRFDLVPGEYELIAVDLQVQFSDTLVTVDSSPSEIVMTGPEPDR